MTELAACCTVVDRRQWMNCHADEFWFTAQHVNVLDNSSHWLGRAPADIHVMDMMVSAVLVSTADIRVVDMMVSVQCPGKHSVWWWTELSMWSIFHHRWVCWWENRLIHDVHMPQWKTVCVCLHSYSCKVMQERGVARSWEVVRFDFLLPCN